MFLIASIVQFYIGKEFYLSSLNALKHKIADMNLLVVIGTSAAYFYSTFVLFFPQIFPENARNLYFESSVAIITFLLLGKFLEEKSKNKASSFLKSLFNLKPKKATILVDGKEVEIDADSIVEGDVVILKEGEKVPIDGVILEGSCEVDSSAITGESLYQSLSKGSKVISGSVVKSGYCKLKATTSGGNSTINQIIDFVLKAQSQKPKIAKLADKIVYYFVPAILLISIFVFNVWFLLTDNLQNALIASVSVLIIACPCALGLATPIAVVSTVGRGAKEGILIKDTDCIEKIKGIKTVAFDKTGTITEGSLSVSKVNLDENLLPVLKSLTCKSSHVVSKAVCSYLEDIPEVNIDKFEIIQGEGIVGYIGEKRFLVGNKRLLKRFNISLNIDLNENAGEINVFFAEDDEVKGYISLKDKLRENSRFLIKWLKENGYKTVIISGDTKVNVEQVAKELEVDGFFAQVKPDEKAKIIEDLRKEGGVLFVGDGINDAAAMKVADISVAVHKGTDLAKEAGDIVLMKDDILQVKKVISLLKLSNSVVKQNLLWAYIYNVIGIPVAGGILYPFFGILLKPAYAGLAMAFSSITVVMNALRIQVKGLD